MHGNTYLEICDKCGKDHFRNFRVRNQTIYNIHNTGRKCENGECLGDLKDTIINFKESLNKNILQLANYHSMKSDLMICLGSSL